jgi:hypothetical protein
VTGVTGRSCRSARSREAAAVRRRAHPAASAAASRRRRARWSWPSAAIALPSAAPAHDEETQDDRRPGGHLGNRSEMSSPWVRSRTIGGLTVRCFRTVRRPDGWCPAPVARLVLVAMLVSGRSQAWTGCPAAYRTPATSVDEYSLPQPPRTWQLYAARRRTNPGPLPPQATGRLGEHGRRRPARSPVARARTGRLCRRPCRTLALWPSGMASRFRTPRPDGRVQWSSGGTSCGCVTTARSVPLASAFSLASVAAEPGRWGCQPGSRPPEQARRPSARLTPRQLARRRPGPRPRTLPPALGPRAPPPGRPCGPRWAGRTTGRSSHRRRRWPAWNPARDQAARTPA